MRVFVHLRQLMVPHRALAGKPRELEDHIQENVKNIVAIFAAIQ
jgi:hypothetical protein